jgi:hypothetical protein
MHPNVFPDLRPVSSPAMRTTRRTTRSSRLSSRLSSRRYYPDRFPDRYSDWYPPSMLPPPHGRDGPDRPDREDESGRAGCRAAADIVLASAAGREGTLGRGSCDETVGGGVCENGNSEDNREHEITSHGSSHSVVVQGCALPHAFYTVGVVRGGVVVGA